MKAFIDDHRADYGVEPICKVLPIAPSTYYAHAARKADPALRSRRAKIDDALVPEIRRVWDENFAVYGVRKVWRQMLREGHDVARCTIARLMRKMGLSGVIRGKRVKTTVLDEALAETINGLYKAEVIWRKGPWRSFEAVEFATLEWVDWFNNRRPLEPIAFRPPAEADAAYDANLEVPAQLAA